MVVTACLARVAPAACCLWWLGSLLAQANDLRLRHPTPTLSSGPSGDTECYDNVTSWRIIMTKYALLTKVCHASPGDCHHAGDPEDGWPGDKGHQRWVIICTLAVLCFAWIIWLRSLSNVISKFKCGVHHVTKHVTNNFNPESQESAGRVSVLTLWSEVWCQPVSLRTPGPGQWPRPEFSGTVYNNGRKTIFSSPDQIPQILTAHTDLMSSIIHPPSQFE